MNTVSSFNSVSISKNAISSPGFKKTNRKEWFDFQNHNSHCMYITLLRRVINTSRRNFEKCWHEKYKRKPTWESYI